MSGRGAPKLHTKPWRWVALHPIISPRAWVLPSCPLTLRFAFHCKVSPQRDRTGNIVLARTRYIRVKDSGARQIDAAELGAANFEAHSTNPRRRRGAVVPGAGRLAAVAVDEFAPARAGEAVDMPLAAALLVVACLCTWRFCAFRKAQRAAE